jgi:hypothetical protein
MQAAKRRTSLKIVILPTGLDHQLTNELNRVLRISHTEWFKAIVVILAGRFFTRLNSKTRLKILPIDIFRVLKTFIEDTGK